MRERNFEWIDKIPVGIMQLGTDLKVMFVNDEAKRLLSSFNIPLQGGYRTSSTKSYSQPCIGENSEGGSRTTSS